jgi:hypothetical protein
MKAGIFEISESLGERLTAGGWRVDRDMEVAGYIEAWTNRGVAVNDHAKRILASFGGLEFRMPNGGITAIAFDPKLALRTLLPIDLEYLMRIIQEPVCPIGRGGGYYLLVTPSGKILLLQEDWFCLFFADSLGGMLDLLFDKKQDRCTEVQLRADQKPPAYRDDEI